MDTAGTPRYKMPDVTDAERTLTDAEIGAQKRNAWRAVRRNSSFLLIGLSFGCMMGAPVWTILVLPIMAFIIWPWRNVSFP